MGDARARRVRRRHRSARPSQVGRYGAHLGRPRVIGFAPRIFASGSRGRSTPTSTIRAAAASTIRARPATSWRSISGCSQPLGVRCAAPEFPIDARRIGCRRGDARARQAAATRCSIPAPRGRTSAGRPSRLGAWRRRCASGTACRQSHLWGRASGRSRTRSSPSPAAPRSCRRRPSIADLVALARGAAVMVSGDTGPTHIAAAVGTPLVGIFGPTRPERNGPWSPDDVTVSRDDDLSVSSPAPLPGSRRCACWTSGRRGARRRRTSACGGASRSNQPSMSDHPRLDRAARARVARFRVALGFALGVVVLWLAEPTGATIAAGGGASPVSARRFGSGRPVIFKKSREVTSSGRIDGSRIRSTSGRA